MSESFEPRTERTPQGGKRLAMAWCPWMGDWFVSHSPRNGNENAEGPWDQWVDMAIQILQHPATELTRPEAFVTVRNLPIKDYYSETDRALTDSETAALFGDPK